MKIVPLFSLIVLFACNNPQNSSSEVQDRNTTSSLTIDENADAAPQTAPMVYVTLETSAGEIGLELDPNKAPLTVKNFISYVNDGTYENTIFHRVIPNFMVQGGGFTAEGEQKQTGSPIILESNNGLLNTPGTIAMARTNAPNSATNQFFINVNDNRSLNYTPGNAGYAVFGKVITGMEVVNEIRAGATTSKGPHANWPVDPVKIKRAYVQKAP